MKELTRTRRLTIIIVVFVAVLIAGFLTLSKPKYTYVLSPEQTLEGILSSENEISPEFLLNVLKKNDASYVLVDVRSPYAFNKGSFNGALNIPVSEMLTDESISFFKNLHSESVSVILFGKDQTEANGPFMFLKQLGFEDIKVLLGGYDYFSKINNSTTTDSEFAEYQAEKPLADFSKILKSNSEPNDISESENNSRKQIVPVRRKKKAVTAGGC